MFCCIGEISCCIADTSLSQIGIECCSRVRRQDNFVGKCWVNLYRTQGVPEFLILYKSNPRKSDITSQSISKCHTNPKLKWKTIRVRNTWMKAPRAPADVPPWLDTALFQAAESESCNVQSYSLSSADSGQTLCVLLRFTEIWNYDHIKWGAGVPH